MYSLVHGLNSSVSENKKQLPLRSALPGWAAFSLPKDDALANAEEGAARKSETPPCSLTWSPC